MDNYNMENYNNGIDALIIKYLWKFYLNHNTIVEKEDWNPVIFHKLRELQARNWRKIFESQKTLEEYLGI